jgi:uncharacterized protein (TIGR00375 family)
MLVADLHLHSKYSRATSKDMDLESLEKWAGIKGINVLGTADFTHPLWFEGLKNKLEPAEEGLFKIKNGSARFLLSTEISCIYSKGGKVRKIHIIVLAPSFEAVEKINAKLGQIGNLKADGRPILGLDALDLAKICWEASKDCLVIPAHAWTPWFGVFGSKSGFDSMEECFGDYSKYIYSIETGLSSDPAMNWRLSSLDNITLISNSDAHSPSKIGREANVFNVGLSYPEITGAIKEGSPDKFLYTVEFFPEEGKYHYDGHRACEVSLSPKKSKKYNNTCPVCGRPLTIGVMNRVEELADRPEGFKPEGAVPFKSLVPLKEIIAEAFGVGAGSLRVGKEYDNLIKNVGSEFEILLSADKKDLAEAAGPEIAEGVVRVREGKVQVEPGYDGVYGKVKIFSQNKKRSKIRQKTLF